MRDPKDITINGRQLSDILQAHHIWLTTSTTEGRANLSRANLSGADLSDADLSGADLSRAKEYRVGETVRPDKWDENRFNECSNGIHFFITRIEAENY